MDYQKEQARLLRLFEEVETDEQNYGSDDDDEQDDIDNVEQRSGSDTEQEFDDGADNCDDVPVVVTREPYFIGKDNITKWDKHCPPKNVRTRHTNIVVQ